MIDSRNIVLTGKQQADDPVARSLAEAPVDHEEITEEDISAFRKTDDGFRTGDVATQRVAHKLARIIYHLITHRVAYDDSILAAEERQDRRRFERRLRRQAHALGYELVPEAA